MKKILIFTTLLGYIFTSCYKDLGNYEYTIIEGSDQISAKLESVLDTTAFPTATLFEEYRVDVNLPKDITNDYDIYWELIYGDIPGKVCDGASLVFTPTKLISSIEFHIVARHKTYKTEYVAEKQVEISESYGQGWLILGRKDGKSTLSFIEPVSNGDYFNPIRLDWKISKNFKTNLNPNAKEINLGYYSYFDTDYNNVSVNYVVLKDNGDGEILDAVDFSRISTMTESSMAPGYNNYKEAFYAGDISVYLGPDNFLYARQGNNGKEKFASTPLSYKGLPFKASAIIAPDQMLEFGPNDASYAPVLTEDGTEIKFISMYKEGGSGIPGEIFDLDETIPTDVDLHHLPKSEVITSMLSNKDGSYTNFLYYIILKTGNKYQLLQFEIEKSYSFDFDTYEMIVVFNFGNATLVELNNNSSIITDDTKLVKGSDSGIHHYFWKDKKIYVLTAAGEISEFMTLEEDIIEIGTNPQKTEMIVITKGGKLKIISIPEDLQNPEILKDEQFDVDEFIDITYKYTSLLDASTQEKD